MWFLGKWGMKCLGRGGRCSVRSKDVDMTIFQVDSLDEEL